MVHLDFLGLLGGFGLMTALGVTGSVMHVSHDRFEKDVLDRFVKDALEVPLRQCRALQIFHRPDLFGDLHGALVGDRGHLPLSQLLAHFRIISEVEFGADQNDGDAWRVMLDFRVPLRRISAHSPPGGTTILTLALTLSNDDGLTMEKQMRKTSVCG